MLSWAGTRGVISLAAIFTLPLATRVGGAVPRPRPAAVLYLRGRGGHADRQGVTFAPMARALGVHADPADAAALRNEARAASVKAGPA